MLINKVLIPNWKEKSLTAHAVGQAPSSWKMCVGLHRHCYYDFKCTSVTLFSTILAMPACTKGKVCEQVSPATLLIYRGTVWEMKWCGQGENCQMSWGRVLNCSVCKQVICFVCAPGWSTLAILLYKKMVCLFRLINHVYLSLCLSICREYCEHRN